MSDQLYSHQDQNPNTSQFQLVQLIGKFLVAGKKKKKVSTLSPRYRMCHVGYKDNFISSS